jgi:hypothetical protein
MWVPHAPLLRVGLFLMWVPHAPLLRVGMFLNVGAPCAALARGDVS